ncbi:hypothetical protein BKA56DRAFT_563654 [Ilyonectria sp. MPI-CAGE-AT-0026]|nr:hypothetical protein BKA56DRAFT_563654 [Ilyonectria sp. MPI-CAGE-AT-0026]
MARVLVTGGNGFVAQHILSRLIGSGYPVVTTVRSKSKGEGVLEKFGVPSRQLSFGVVEDIARPGAYDEVLKANPLLQYVIHTASPFRFDYTDLRSELLEPAVSGTSGILRSIQSHSPQVKRVVITSSLAAMIMLGSDSGTINESQWNPATYEDAMKSPEVGYSYSKKLAENAAWDFVKAEKPEFSVTTICPPLIFGPATQLNSLEHVNTSNQLFLAFIRGAFQAQLPATQMPLWVDVRDVADAHITALEVQEAANERFLIVGGRASNADIANEIREQFPDLRSKLPAADSSCDPLPDGLVYDTSKSQKVLGLKYRSLSETVSDTVKSLLKFLD